MTAAGGSGVPTDIATVPACFRERVRLSPAAVAYASFDRVAGAWVEKTWGEIDADVMAWRRGFAGAGLEPGDRVAVLLDNGPDWVRCDQASLAQGLVNVPLFSSDNPQNWAFVLSDSAPRVLVVGKAEDWRKLAPLREAFPSVTEVICLVPPGEEGEGATAADDWLARGVAPADVDVQPDWLATITYSSGTTGRPKGVMLDHGSLLAAARSVLDRNSGSESDVFLSILPMAHVFARTVEYYLAMLCGGRMVFARSASHIAEDMATVRPTVLMGVPRIYERVWAGVEESAGKSGLAAWAFRTALALYPQRDRSFLHGLASRFFTSLVRPKVMERFGGRLRLTVSGSAPLSPDLANGFRALGFPLVEGYGMAEAAGPVSGDAVDDYAPGTVGRLLSGVEARISEGGELEIRSRSVMKGYWNRAAESAETIVDGGWLRTGDLAVWTGDGRLKIVGRVHDVIGLSNGEKLAPADAELALTRDPLFDQAIVFGNKRPFIVGVVVLNPVAWRRFAAERGLHADDPNGKAEEKALLDHVAALTKDLPRYARLRRLHATLDPWTPETGLVTVTLKAKRPVIQKHYADVVEEFYRTRGG